MSCSLLELPQDVLLELLKHLSLDDVINFLALCRVIRELQLQKSLWLDALVRVREVEIQPLPLPAGVSLRTLSLQELQHTARRANRLVKNLQSQDPRPVRIHTLSAERESGLFCISGANLAVTHTRGRVSCWDLLTCQRVAHLEIEFAPFLVMTQPYTETEGMAIFGAAIGFDSVAYLVAVRIDYHDRAHISMSHLLSPAVDEDYPKELNHFFTTAHVVGFIAELSIVTWCTDDPTTTGSILREPLNIPSSHACLTLAQNLYVFNAGSAMADAWVQRVPSSWLPDSSRSNTLDDVLESDSIITKLGVSYPSAAREIQGDRPMRAYSTSQMVVPRYGVFAVTCRHIQWGDRKSVIHFWAADIAQTILRPSQGYSYELQGEIRLVAVGGSGTYVVFLVDDEGPHVQLDQGRLRFLDDRNASLGLLHFISDPTPCISFRKLDIGDASSVHEIAIDDSLGIILVLDQDGKMRAISYA